MSRASKLTLLGVSSMAAGIVYFVHYSQTVEREALHKGVIRDMEQQRVKRERQQDFEVQKKLEEEFRKVQPVTEADPKGQPG